MALLLATAVACGREGSPAVSGPALTKVTIQGYAFPPISAKPGAKLEITVKDPEHHTITADDGSFDFGPVEPDQPATFTAPTATGNFPIHCRIHSTMKGTLTIG